jgi:hypothetical protein
VTFLAFITEIMQSITVQVSSKSSELFPVDPGEEMEKAIKQTICHSIIPLAYSLWGIMKKTSDIDLLLIFQKLLYHD